MPIVPTISFGEVTVRMSAFTSIGRDYLEKKLQVSVSCFGNLLPAD